MFQEFLIGVTNFFRDPEAFESLKQSALKDMIKEKNNTDIFRIWVPGCSSGEEVYSIAIIIRELLEETGKNLEVQIFGTDLDPNSIKTARSGTYSNISEDIGPERLHKYFYKKDNLYTIKNDIRDMVIFANHNVITDPPFTKLDLISCRNLLIYLESEAQERVLSNMNYALKKDGILFIGPSENIGDFLEAFSVIDNKWKIFKCVKSSRVLFDHIKTRTISYQQPHSYWNNQFALKDLKVGQTDLNITKIAEKNLIDIYAPPSALINKLGDILFIHGRLGKYLEPSPGRAHMNILEMAREGIKLGLSTAIQNAISNNKEVVFDSLQVDSKDNKDYIKLIVKPINDQDSVKGLLIVSFEESDSQNLGQERIKLHIDSNNNEHIKSIENELKLTKERLKANVEEMTTSNEELKSANEELQSLNEESQSTNEELETSKEELQSTNEELSTVNSELQIKIDELSRINDDMINLFNSSEIAIIFVDNDLKIRSFTKESNKLIKLIESDIGRPLSDIAISIEYPDLMDDIIQVTEKLVFKEKEVKTKDDEWYKVRIMPYKTSQNVIDGVTITFINITNLKTTQEKIQSALDYDEGIINTVHEPLVVLDEKLRIISANRSFLYDI